LTKTRRLDEAWEVLERWRKLGTMANRYHVALARYYGARSEFARAFDELDRAGASEATVVRWNERVWLYVLSGDLQMAKKLVAELEGQPDVDAHAAELAFCHGVLGDLDECFSWLGKAFDAHDVWPWQWLEEPTLAKVRKDPRFAHLLKKMNLA